MFLIILEFVKCSYARLKCPNEGRLHSAKVKVAWLSIDVFDFLTF